MVVTCYAGDITEYDRKTSELSNAALHMKQKSTVQRKIHLDKDIDKDIDIDIDIDIPSYI